MPYPVHDVRAPTGLVSALADSCKSAHGLKLAAGENKLQRLPRPVRFLTFAMPFSSVWAERLVTPSRTRRVLIVRRARG